ncbi:MAG: hypothetical protein N2378_14540, partial [Chloroflexaceae bacterium]|nr:hypothetical protein [Chloroflexaceae bacterium]
VEGNGTPTPSRATPTHGEEAVALVEKDGLLVVRRVPLRDFGDIVEQEREDRIAELLPALADRIVSPLE